MKPPETDGFYRPTRFATPITTADTPSTISGWAYDEDVCIHCGATYGHKAICPLLNRDVAENESRRRPN